MTLIRDRVQLGAGQRISSRDRARITAAMDKYAEILGAEGRPPVVVRDNIGSEWLGRALFRLQPDGGREITIELQRVLLSDDIALERVVAHEMAHYVEMQELTDTDIALMKRGHKRLSHGKRFHELAAQVNEAVGDPKFVTVTSDFVDTETSRPFYVLIYPIDGGQDGRFAYAWAARLTQRMMRTMEPVLSRGALLVKTTDSRWTHTTSRIGSGAFAVPAKPEDQEKLRALYMSVADQLLASRRAV